MATRLWSGSESVNCFSESVRFRCAITLLYLAGYPVKLCHAFGMPSGSPLYSERVCVVPKQN